MLRCSARVSRAVSMNAKKVEGRTVARHTGAVNELPWQPLLHNASPGASAEGGNVQPPDRRAQRAVNCEKVNKPAEPTLFNGRRHRSRRP